MPSQGLQKVRACRAGVLAGIEAELPCVVDIWGKPQYAIMRASPCDHGSFRLLMHGTYATVRPVVL
jgi:hypothetical protein